LVLNVNGTGTGDFSASGSNRAIYNAEVLVAFRNETSGATYETRISAPDGHFMVTNVEPGDYTIQKLWFQVQTTNAYVTLTSGFKTPPTFSVPQHSIANLGTMEWEFAYDLSSSTSSSSVKLTHDYSLVSGALSGVVKNTPWSTYDVSEVQIKPESLEATSQASPLMPRSPGGHPFYLPSS
jgi:hypothetical protein